jgi:hypothetical protein
LKKLTPPTASLQLSQLPLNTTFSRNKGSHINGGCCGWSEPCLRKYDKLCAAIKNEEISPNTQPGAPRNASVTTKERVLGEAKQLFDQKESKMSIQMHGLV